MTWEQDVQGITVPNDEPQGDGLLRMQWRNGEPKLRSGGRFFIPAERIEPYGVVPGAPWREGEEIFEDGSSSVGYVADTLRLMFIGARSQPYRREDGGKVWLERWEAGASMQAEALVLVEGLDDIGPMVWTSATIKTSFAITARGDKNNPAGIIPNIQSKMLKVAQQTAKSKMPLWSFWATVSTERDAKKAVVYTQTQGKPVTRPVLLLPDEVTREWLVKQYVGKALLERGAEWRAEYDEWLRTRRTNDAAPAEHDEPQAPRRNIPEEIPVDENGIPLF